jgi:hypothetical protein
VPVERVRDALRQAFGRWGRPRLLRVDNGHPWGATGGLPTALELWAAGLGVGLIRNPPRRPQRNGVVERSQGTAKRWAEPQACADAATLQRRLDEEDRVQREAFPAVGGLSRRAAFPALLGSGRGYALAWERYCWDAQEALRLLAGVTVSRKVSQAGKVSLYDRAYVVGAAHRGAVVRVGFDPQTQEWVFRDAAGAELRRQRAVGLDAEQVMALRVSRER